MICPCCHEAEEADQFTGELYREDHVARATKQFGAPVCDGCLNDLCTCPHHECERLFMESTGLHDQGEVFCSEDCSIAFAKETDAYFADLRSERTC